MRLENATKRILDCFERSIFPEAHEFTDAEIEAIATLPGIDGSGTFTGSPIEQSLIRKYELDASYGEHSWPGFAEFIREQKTEVLLYRSYEDKFALLLAQLKEARAECIRMGSPREEIDIRIERAELSLEHGRKYKGC